MVSFCEDSLIGGSNIHVKKGVYLVLLPDFFCSFRYLVKSSRPFLSHDNHSVVAKSCNRTEFGHTYGNSRMDTARIYGKSRKCTVF